MPQFGVWDLVHARAGVEADDLYAQHLEEMELAEALGFDEYWVAEHIFHREHSLLPSPGLLLAASRGRVQRLKLGVMVYVLPLHDPLRLAAVGDESLVWAAEQGIAVARGPEPPHALARAKDRYDEVYQAAGHRGRPSLRIMRWVHVAESDEAAQAGARPWLFKMLQLFTGLSRPGVEP